LLICFRPRLIFIKTAKTAGTSTEAYLQKIFLGGNVAHEQGWALSDNGIVTPRYSGGQRENFAKPSRVEQWRWARISKISRLEASRWFALKNHSSPSQIRSAVGDKFWDESIKIANVRNPFDLLVSWYFFMFRDTDRRPEFNDWILSSRKLMRGFAAELPPQIDDSWRVIRYESLQLDLESLLQEFQVSSEVQLPMMKSSFREKSQRDLKKLYNPQSVAKVEDAWGDWLAKFDYSF
jgi:hypothetical protein